MVARLVRDQKVAGSNPVTSTIFSVRCVSIARFFCLKRIKNLLFHRAISELRKNGGSLTGKGSVSAGVWNAGGVPETVRRYFFAFFSMYQRVTHALCEEGQTAYRYGGICFKFTMNTFLFQSTLPLLLIFFYTTHYVLYRYSFSFCVLP